MVVFLLIFASGAWFGPLYAKREWGRFALTQAGSFVLLFLAYQDVAPSTVRALGFATTTTLMLTIGSAVMGTRLKASYTDQQERPPNGADSREAPRSGGRFSQGGRSPTTSRHKKPS
jgi:hypothetical protein